MLSLMCSNQLQRLHSRLYSSPLYWAHLPLPPGETSVYAAVAEASAFLAALRSATQKQSSSECIHLGPPSSSAN